MMIYLCFLLTLLFAGSIQASGDTLEVGGIVLAVGEQLPEIRTRVEDKGYTLKKLVIPDKPLDIYHILDTRETYLGHVELTPAGNVWRIISYVRYHSARSANDLLLEFYDLVSSIKKTEGEPRDFKVYTCCGGTHSIDIAFRKKRVILSAYRGSQEYRSQEVVIRTELADLFPESGHGQVQSEQEQVPHP